jgi:hypothetical protein
MRVQLPAMKHPYHIETLHLPPSLRCSSWESMIDVLQVASGTMLMETPRRLPASERIQRTKYSIERIEVVR